MCFKTVRRARYLKISEIGIFKRKKLDHALVNSFASEAVGRVRKFGIIY